MSVAWVEHCRPSLPAALSRARPRCIGGVAFVRHSIDYNNWLPTLTTRYRLQQHWSVYAQFAEGSVIPPSAVFDVPGGNVLVPQEPTLAKNYQIGSVVKYNRWTRCRCLLRSFPEWL